MGYSTKKFLTATSVLCLISCLLLWIVVVLNCVAFGTRNWLVSDGYSPFIKAGYFMVCFDQCSRPYCPVGDDDMILDKCYHLWPNLQDDYYIQEQWHWLTPEWFKICRILVIINIPLTVCTAMILTLASLICLAERDATEPDKNKDWLVLLSLYSAAVLNLVTGCLAVGSVSHFYGNAFRRDWMPLPDKNHLGYSFWMEVVCAIFLILSAFFCLIAGLLKTSLVGTEEEEPMFSEDMSHVTR